MKTILFIIMCVVMVACNDEGQVIRRSEGSIDIGGKCYKFIQVIPADGEHGVWLLIPEDQDIEIPQPTSYNYTVTHTSGKHMYTTTETITCLFIKS